MDSDSIKARIDELLLNGKASTAHEAEEMFLDAHLAELARLVSELDDGAFRNHEAIKLLMAQGSRRMEDALSWSANNHWDPFIETCSIGCAMCNLDLQSTLL